jgi:osmotically-inducible protein OsmY
MFDGYDGYQQDFETNQFVASAVSDAMETDLRHCVTLIGGNDYGLEVQLSGYVSVEREASKAEAFLASLYELG